MACLVPLCQTALCSIWRPRQSKYELVNYGVPQGSVLGPLQFIIYTADLSSLVTAHQLHPHQYADDVNIYGWRPPMSSCTLRDQMLSCVQDICLWMRSHRLQLNTGKTEFIWCCPSRRRRHIPDGDFIGGVDRVEPVSAAQNLGVFLDGELSMRPHIFHVAASCLVQFARFALYEDRYHPCTGNARYLSRSLSLRLLRDHPSVTCVDFNQS